MSAATAYNKYGVSRVFIRYLMHGWFNFPANYKDTLKEYKLIYWNPEYFCATIKDGSVERHGVKYQVVYDRCNARTIKDYQQILLSFRQAQDELNLPAVVIVRPVKVITGEEIK